MDEQPDVETGGVADASRRPFLDETAREIAKLYQDCSPGGEAFEQLTEFALGHGVPWGLARHAFTKIREAFLDWWRADPAASEYDIRHVDTTGVILERRDQEAIIHDFWEIVDANIR
jgi:hypothetical protein